MLSENRGYEETMDN